MNLSMTGAVCDEQFYGRATAQKECVALWKPKKTLAELILFRCCHITEMLKGERLSMFASFFHSACCLCSLT